MLKVSKILTKDTLDSWKQDSSVNIEISESRTSRLKIEGSVSCTILIKTGDNPKLTAKALKGESIKPCYTKAQKEALKDVSSMMKSKGYVKASLLDSLIKLFSGNVPSLPEQYIKVFNQYIKK